MKLRPLDYAERNGYVRGVVRDLIHDPGRGAPIVKVQFNNPYKYKKDNYQWTATEGTYTGQFIYCGKKGAPPPHRSAPPTVDRRSITGSGTAAAGRTARRPWKYRACRGRGCAERAGRTLGGISLQPRAHGSAVGSVVGMRSGSARQSSVARGHWPVMEQPRRAWQGACRIV